MICALLRELLIMGKVNVFEYNYYIENSLKANKKLTIFQVSLKESKDLEEVIETESNLLEQQDSSLTNYLVETASSWEKWFLWACLALWELLIEVFSYCKKIKNEYIERKAQTVSFCRAILRNWFCFPDKYQTHHQSNSTHILWSRTHACLSHGFNRMVLLVWDSICNMHNNIWIWFSIISTCMLSTLRQWLHLRDISRTSFSWCSYCRDGVTYLKKLFLIEPFIWYSNKYYVQNYQNNWV